MIDAKDLPSDTPDDTRNGGDDAVCFTSGPAGGPFSAGVIHAWLAIDRKPPLVAAGISTGAISAAAMRRVYQELNDTSAGLSQEERRWAWFRRYLQAATNNPQRAIWDALPDAVDFTLASKPVRDNSVPDSLRQEAEEARRHYHILTKLGVWIAETPVRLSTVANLVVTHVRLKEGYAPFGTQLLFSWNLLKALVGLWWHVLHSPWFDESNYDLFAIERDYSVPAHSSVDVPQNTASSETNGPTSPDKTSPKRRIRPLVGWTCWGIATASALFSLTIVAVFFWLSCSSRMHLTYYHWWHIVLGMSPGRQFFFVLYVIVQTILLWMIVRHFFAKNRVVERILRLKDRLVVSLLRSVDLEKALLHTYEASRQIYDLFQHRAANSVVMVKPSDVTLLVVCAALEKIEQVCLRPEMRVVDALVAAIAIPGLFRPQRRRQDAVFTGQETPKGASDQYLNLIDGAKVRANPIPAFFEWCKYPESRETVKKLERASSSDPSLHVIYSVPVGYHQSLQDAPPMVCPDVIQSIFGALDLEKRRDTRQEVRQTNYSSELEAISRRVKQSQSSNPETPIAPANRGPFVIFADEIAPQVGIEFSNSLKPDHAQLMQTASEGCRATLETLYRAEIQNLGHGKKELLCTTLLASKAIGRRQQCGQNVTGLPEICAGCSGVLQLRPSALKDTAPAGLLRNYGASDSAPNKVDEHLCNEFAHLTGVGNVVFLGSGGVFRGAFHIGVIGAITILKLYPDLVVGASVGTLMGGALCNIAAGTSEDEVKVLERLANIFLRVDSSVALTKTLKSAAKQLGVRARRVKLSPSQLTRMVNRGSEADAGFAATGAPPALIDALSYLFAIPHGLTASIASDFVAGHVSEAANAFLSALRDETLDSLDIRTFIMGTSLLEDRVRELLGDGVAAINLSSVQPYHGPKVRRRSSFFGTTSFLNANVSLLLGRDFLTSNQSWDATFMGLSSSAFPAVFAPRTEADQLPGRGRVDRYFADGGLFDNLPFFPALEVLMAVQKAQAARNPRPVSALLKERLDRPNLILAAGLNAPAEDDDREYPTLLEIQKRASSLGFTSKTSTFSHGSRKTTAALKDLVKNDLSSLSPEDRAFLTSSVVTNVLPIWPSSDEHLNGTFAFCRTMGLNTETIQRSIADGCYRTLAKVTEERELMTNYLQDGQSVTRVELDADRQSSPAPNCPHFHQLAKPFGCPFQRSADPLVSAIRNVCATDGYHRADI